MLTIDMKGAVGGEHLEIGITTNTQPDDGSAIGKRRHAPRASQAPRRNIGQRLEDRRVVTVLAFDNVPTDISGLGYLCHCANTHGNFRKPQ